MRSIRSALASVGSFVAGGRVFLTTLALLVALCSTALYAWVLNCNPAKPWGTNGGYSQVVSGLGSTWIQSGTPTSNAARVEVWIYGLTMQPTCPTGVKYGSACMNQGNMTTGSQSVTAQADYNTGGYNFRCFTVKSNNWSISSDGGYHPPTCVGCTVQNSGDYCIPPPPHHDPILCPNDGIYYCGSSPIVIPTGALFIRISDPAGGVAFDIDGDGTLDQVGWPVDGDRVAFLAYDANGNGTIDNGTELFGNHTLPDEGNGFEALRHLTLGKDAEKGFVDESNPFFASRLLLWNDRNRDGVSQPDELSPAVDRLHAIGLGYSTTARVDANGNAFRIKGWAEFKGPLGGTYNRPVYDVFLSDEP